MVRGTDGHACLFLSVALVVVSLYLHVQQFQDGLIGFLEGFNARSVESIVVVLAPERYRSGLSTLCCTGIMGYCISTQEKTVSAKYHGIIASPWRPQIQGDMAI